MKIPLLLGLLLSFPAVDCQAAEALPGVTVGAATATVLPIVQREHPASVLILKDEAQKAAAAKAYPDGKIRNALNVMLVEGKGYTALVDTGLPDTLPALLEALKAQGVAPDQVSHVIITHAHGDHVGGLVKDGQAVFPKARLVFSQQEHAFWNTPENKAKAPERAARVFEQWPQVLQPYAGRVDVAEPGVEIAPGLSLLAAYGHTPGHVGVLLQAPDKTLLFWGDLLHAALVQIPDPSISATYDLDPGLAAANRKAVLQQAAREGWLVSGVHMPDARTEPLP